MRIECPHGHHHVELVELDTLTRCPTCGSKVSVVVDTVSYARKARPELDGYELVARLGMGQFGEASQHRSVHSSGSTPLASNPSNSSAPQVELPA
ncbi:MAG: hypothetical protein FJ295_17645 [Planctomycetes bacterium]|nr:hypothetical protein [Planctomycetota bacterium]